MVPTNVSIGVRSKYCDVRCGRVPLFSLQVAPTGGRRQIWETLPRQRKFSLPLSSLIEYLNTFDTIPEREREQKKERNKRDRRKPWVHSLSFSLFILSLLLWFFLYSSFSLSLLLWFFLSCLIWNALTIESKWRKAHHDWLVYHTLWLTQNRGRRKRREKRGRERDETLGRQNCDVHHPRYSCLHHQNDDDQGRESFESWKVELEREREKEYERGKEGEREKEKEWERNSGRVRERESIWWWDEDCIIHIPIPILLLIQSWQFFISLSLYLPSFLSFSLFLHLSLFLPEWWLL